MHDVTKLPKWAQEYIERLESEAKDTQKLLEEMGMGEEAPVSWINESLDVWVGIPNRAEILFRLESGGHISVKWREQHLNIYSAPDRLLIEPWAVNSITIHTKR